MYEFAGDLFDRFSQGAAGLGRTKANLDFQKWLQNEFSSLLSQTSIQPIRTQPSLEAPGSSAAGRVVCNLAAANQDLRSSNEDRRLARLKKLVFEPKYLRRKIRKTQFPRSLFRLLK